MAEPQEGSEKKFQSYIPASQVMSEFSIPALIIGLVMCVVLGAANAYLGLKAGMTIAATYPAAVIGMALLRLTRGNVLEENFARTVGSIGESVAAGAIFTLPAFYIAGLWRQDFSSAEHYLISASIMAVGGVLGIMFVAILRRVMVEDTSLPFPESVAAGQIHIAGREGGTGASYLFGAMGAGALIQALGQLKAFALEWVHFVPFASASIKGKGGAILVKDASGGLVLSSPGVSPAYIGVGYIIGPQLAALNFSGGLLAWGLFVPILLYFMSSSMTFDKNDTEAWIGAATNIWRYIVRPMAIGGMLVGAGFTLFRMRAKLIGGMKRSVRDLKAAASGQKDDTLRTDKDIAFSKVLIGIGVAAIATFFIYLYFINNAEPGPVTPFQIGAALLATVVLVFAGFLFAAVSGFLVGTIGSSNNPISGLTLSTLIIAALLLAVVGLKGDGGVSAVLGVAAVVCVSSAVAGEMLQDLKVGHILGGTPWKMQVGDLVGVVLAAAVMFAPLVILNEGDIKMGQDKGYEGGFGGPKLPAPQASLMAMLSQGIIGGDMAWPLIIVGMLMGLAMVLMQVRSPMLISVGMYLPLDTTFAIFLGGIIKWVLDLYRERKLKAPPEEAKQDPDKAFVFTKGQRAFIKNNGVLLASGLIAGEALMGLVFAGLAFFDQKVPSIFENPSFITSLFVFAAIAGILIVIPLLKPGRPDAQVQEMDA